MKRQAKESYWLNAQYPDHQRYDEYHNSNDALRHELQEDITNFQICIHFMCTQPHLLWPCIVYIACEQAAGVQRTPVCWFLSNHQRQNRSLNKVTCNECRLVYPETTLLQNLAVHYCCRIEAKGKQRLAVQAMASTTGSLASQKDLIYIWPSFFGVLLIKLLWMCGITCISST